MNRLIILLLSAATLWPGEIILPSRSLPRDAEVQAIYRLNNLSTGIGKLHVVWTDVHGRTVLDRTQELTLTDENEVRFPLDLRRARALKNDLKVEFSFEGKRRDGRPDKRTEEATIDFIARPSREWWDYVVIMWNGYPSQQIPILKSLGISGGQYVGRNTPPARFLFDNDLRWYAENIATDFYAAYHRFFGDRPVNWLYADAKARYKKDPSSKEPFKRTPSFSDPVWIEKIRTRLIEATRAQSPYAPFFYDLGDESGIADLAAYWDFDFSDHSLAQFRLWLREKYGTLAALNRQWGSEFDAWDHIVPDTTSEAMKRTDNNWSAWSDHKEYMDVEFARAIKMGVDAVQSVEPNAYVGILGAQMPGWGGYDYARLSETLTMFEPYDIGNNIEIIRSIAPRTPVVTTSFAKGPWEKHRIWYELLHGNRGSIIWDDKRDFISREGQVGDRGEQASVYFKEMRRGLGALLMNSERQADRIAIHYSQASMRAEWMKKQQPKGDTWVNRNSSTERRDSEFLRMRESWCRLIEDLGMQYNFVSYLQMERGEFPAGGYRALVLPWSSALSEKEAAVIREFVAQGGLVLTDAEPGVYDEHTRKLEQPRLAGLVQPISLDILNYHQNRLASREAPVRDAVGALLRKQGIEPELKLTDDAGAAVTGVEVHTFRNGGVRLVGLLTNPQLRVDELGPPDFKSNGRFEKARQLKLAFPRPMYAWDVRAGKSLGQVKGWAGTLDPYEPVILALSDADLPKLRVAAPARVDRGATANLSISGAGPVRHVDVADPSGKVVDYYSGNLITGAWSLPVAMSDAAGKWRVTVTDVMTGQKQVVEIEVQ